MKEKGFEIGGGWVPGRLFSETLSAAHVVGPCHHGMVRPQVVDRGMASDK